MAGLHGARSSSDGAQMQIDVENPAQTIGQIDDFKLKTQTNWNNNQLELDQNDSNKGHLTVAQQSQIENAESKSNSKTVAINHDNIINPVHFKQPISEGTYDTKDQGGHSQVVKQAEPIRPGTTETQAHATPRLPGYDQEKIEE